VSVTVTVVSGRKQGPTGFRQSGLVSSDWLGRWRIVNKYVLPLLVNKQVTVDLASLGIAYIAFFMISTFQIGNGKKTFFCGEGFIGLLDLENVVVEPKRFIVSHACRYMLLFHPRSHK
jgi:hypothetical protein